MHKITEVRERQNAQNEAARNKQSTKPNKSKHKSTERSGAALWQFLGPRLKMMVSLQKQWGSIHTMYQSSDTSVLSPCRYLSRLRPIATAAEL